MARIAMCRPGRRSGPGGRVPMDSTNEAANYIKGFCITLITWHHLIYDNFPGHFSYLGNEFVAFYFIVSGYGIFYSLEEKLHGRRLHGILRFYGKRFIRLYPMYWIWFAFGYYPKSGRSAVLDFFLLSLDHPPVWFLNAIVYCYLLSPVLFLVARRLKLWSLAVFTVALLLINVAGHDWQLPFRLAYVYRDIYFFYLFFFASGMVFPWLLARNFPTGRLGLYVAPLLLVFIFCAVQVTHHPLVSLFPPEVSVWNFKLNYYCVPFYLSAMSLTFVILKGLPRLPLQKALIIVGQYSLPIYLVNDYLGYLVVRLLGKGYPDLVYFLVFAGLFPLLVLGCALAQKIVYLPFKLASN
jgi:peptidoglycan/LPS O-acetylase OafA/YrhL